MWRQGHTLLASLHGHGWVREEDGRLRIHWDTEENQMNVKKRVQLLIKGCSYKTGCNSGRCGCCRKNEVCCAGCQCIIM